MYERSLVRWSEPRPSGATTGCTFYKRRTSGATSACVGVAQRLGMSDAAEVGMPERETIERARKDARQGKSASTQAGEFVREEIHHVREGKHGARSTKQAIAIGLSKARRAGVKLRPGGSAAARRKAR